jgi:hypothetical protein
MLGPGCTRGCGCSVEVQLGKRGPGTVRGHEVGRVAEFVRPSQVAAAADAAIVVVADTQFAFAGFVSVAHAL